MLKGELHLAFGEVKEAISSLNKALDALSADNKYLTEGGVFTDDFINNWIDLKYEEVQQLRQRPHPHEFFMYYDA